MVFGIEPPSPDVTVISRETAEEALSGSGREVPPDQKDAIVYSLMVTALTESAAKRKAKLFVRRRETTNGTVEVTNILYPDEYIDEGAGQIAMRDTFNVNLIVRD